MLAEKPKGKQNEMLVLSIVYFSRARAPGGGRKETKDEKEEEPEHKTQQAQSDEINEKKENIKEQQL